MTLTLTTGDLLGQKVDAIVNTVNCVGVMGKGIALQFKRKWPKNFRAYEVACKQGEVRPGKMFVYDAGGLLRPRYIINFPTKKHWRGKSSIDYIEIGLEDLVSLIRELEIKSIAVPPLGCGNGGLEWSEVCPLIEKAMSQVPDVDVRLFEPADATTLRELAAPETAPRMTPGRAAMMTVLSIYRELAYPLSRIEVQKLAYLLEQAGEPLGLSFVKHRYGPYSDKLRHVLAVMDGTYITGLGDQVGRSEIRVVPSALKAATSYLDQSDAGTLERVAKVAATIEGFETPYGMELLATVLWVATEGPQPRGLREIVERVHSWSERKKQLMSEREIEIAWSRLQEQGWVSQHH